MSRKLPLTTHPPEAIIAWHQGEAISTQKFLAQAQALAQSLPEASHAVNLCEDRYAFLLAFAALLIRGQVCLLPPNRATGVVHAVAADYPGSYCLVDQPGTELALSQFAVTPQSEVSGINRTPLIDANQQALVIFTSGSTDTPRSYGKYWGDLVRGAELAADRFALDQFAGGTLVATVPPQHMYGLESTILFALHSPLAMQGERPFYPEDVRQALLQVPAPRLLITTPVHLRACVGAGLAWPPMEMIISATAPLSTALAAEAERHFGCPVQEIYGSTETGAIASRHTLTEPLWRPYESVRLHCKEGRCHVEADFLPRAMPLNDIIDSRAAGFTLLGRDSDMINIAGKRASLTDLTRRLQEIPGVEDGAMVLQDEERERGGRIGALVVAPALSERAILAAMGSVMDPVFIPRTLYRVERLPRNETGKLPRAELLAMLERLRQRDT
ncbi:AMP-binding protein [Thiohalophilus thiocyanatoxydans]|uniref:Acyl-coenzyme A synthetase/AMP-(Fatty) acid ligase n=1 Tax=Thiohalophilus thiocyanatoxydans TaxID=381308 RepID=A0A4R8IYE4_9GAMM|nr:AMP-binding protein [Thiohalophilus thiocyanatoxydans]TDY02957.1 acyl-coenzyme A synthetase/AMP-(fatty) acid ligase [Thiohalophilus thiocyanatoxydans]